MKKTITWLELLAIALTIGLASVMFLFPQKEYRHDLVVVAFGDSLTVGHGVPPGKNFVVYLSEATSIPIINSGVTGDTTAEALVRLKEDVLDKNPNVVTVLLGGNDLLKGNSEEVVRANLKIIIRKIKKIGAKVILIGGSKQLAPNFEMVFEKIAIEEKVAGYVPDVLRGILLRKDLRFDDIHPNDRGHKIIAERILPTLERVLKEQ